MFCTYTFQAAYASVSLNKDGRTVSFKQNKDNNNRKMSTESFVYRVGLVNGKDIMLNVTATVWIRFNNTAGGSVDDQECKNGSHRSRIVPTSTNER